jgi:hypothetical protein
MMILRMDKFVIASEARHAWVALGSSGLFRFGLIDGTRGLL